MRAMRSSAIGAPPQCSTSLSKLELMKLCCGVTVWWDYGCVNAASGYWHRTDGARILRLQRGGDTARFEYLILKLTVSTSSGVRPKLLNINELEEALAVAKRLNEPFGVYLHGFLHQVAFDNDDVAAAEKHLLDYINEAENIPEGIRNMVWLDAAFFYAYGKKDLEAAARFWQQFEPPFSRRRGP